MAFRFTILNFCQVFRNDDGTRNNNPEAGLRLSVSEFAAEDLTKNFDDLSASIFISAQDLCRYLDNAERKASIINQQTGWVNNKLAGWTARFKLPQRSRESRLLFESGAAERSINKQTGNFRDPAGIVLVERGNDRLSSSSAPCRHTVTVAAQVGSGLRGCTKRQTYAFSRRRSIK